ncbi:leukocyte elastase inhibitor-like [Brevipalpus obovatus]|uniref:leukocyte elastase inhibitor-like n=1 Tax=Brevipalpus obovatus TaxID=246614 RepID=UPI003D9F9CE0
MASSCWIISFPIGMQPMIMGQTILWLIVSTMIHMLASVNTLANGQVISFGMRKLAYSTNQFGLDLLRAMDKSEPSIGFCPICISSSLVMMLMGSQGNGASSLRHALYLWGMQTSEINLAFHDMMTHLGVNMPAAVMLRSVSSNVPSAAASSSSSSSHHHHHHSSNYYYDDLLAIAGNQYRASGSSPNSIASSLPSSATMSLTDTEAASGNDIAFLSHVYVQRDFGINYNYHMLLQRFYKTAIHPVDFIDNSDETRHHINAMIEKETRGKIPAILPERLAPTTQLLLISALYFKASLDLNITSYNRRRESRAFPHLGGFAHPLHTLPPPIPYTPPPSISSSASPSTLQPPNTSNRPTLLSQVYKQPISMFTSNGQQQQQQQSNPSNVGGGGHMPPPPPPPPPMIGDGFSGDIFGNDHVILEAKNARIRYGINRYLNCTAIEMPFKGGLITMIAIMPNDPHGLDTVLTKLSAQVLSDVVNSLAVKRVNVKIPRLNFEKSDTNLTLSLANLGLGHIFKPGYSQLYDVSDYKWLHVSDMIHKTYLEIRDNPPPSSTSSMNSIMSNGISNKQATSASYRPHGNPPSQQQQQQQQQPPPSSLPSGQSSSTSNPNSNIIDVIFDKPFLYFIMDNISGLILAMGKYGREPVNYRLPI